MGEKPLAIQVRVSSLEKAAFERASESAGVSLSRWLRALGRQASGLYEEAGSTPRIGGENRKLSGADSSVPRGTTLPSAAAMESERFEIPHDVGMDEAVGLMREKMDAGMREMRVDYADNQLEGREQERFIRDRAPEVRPNAAEVARLAKLAAQGQAPAVEPGESSVGAPVGGTAAERMKALRQTLASRGLDKTIVTP